MNLLAQLRNPVLPKELGGGASPDYTRGGEVVGSLVGNIVGLIFIFTFFLAFLYLLTGAMAWVTSSGDKASLEAARNKITHAIVGLIIVAATWAIMSIVAQFVGFKDFPKLPIPTIEQTTQQTETNKAIESFFDK